MPIRRPSTATLIALLATLAIGMQMTVAADAAPNRTKSKSRWSDTSAPQRIRALGVTAADTTSVGIAWSRSRDNVGIAGYGVYLDGARRGTTERTSYALNALTCGTGYIVGVDAFDAAGNRSSKTSTTVSTNPCADLTAPSAPVGVQRLAMTETSVVLAWTPSDDNVGVVEYGLYVSGLRIGTVSEPSATISNLECGKTYSLGIDAADAAGNRSARSDAFFATAACVDKTPPSAPTGLGVTGATQTAISVKWNASTDNVGVAGYGRYVATSRVGTSTTTTATFGSLQCGTTYTLGIDAADAAGNRSAKSTMTAATAACTQSPPPASGDTTAPTAPQNLSVSSATQTSIAIGWGAASDNVGVTNYRIYRNGTMIGQGPGSSGGFSDAWTDSGRTCGTSYQYAVEAQDAAGNTGPKATVTASTAACTESQPPSSPPPSGDTTAPTAPQNLSVSSATQTSIAIGWGAASDNVGVTNYRIYRNGTMIGQGPGSSGGAANAWTDSARTCGTSYQYAVEAQDAAGNTGPKATITAATTPCAVADTSAPTAPANVTASTRTGTSITLTWTASRDNVGVTGYGIYKGGTRVSTTAGTTGIVSGLTCGTNYTLGVEAYDAAGNRSQQGVVLVSTTACSDTQPPTTPTGLTTSNLTQTGVTVKWTGSTDNVGVTGYDVYRNGSKVTTVTGLTSDQTGLSCGTAYTIAVAARDAAGNQSSQAQVVVTTAACSSSTPTSANLLELSGTVSGSQLESAIAAKPSGPLTVRPTSGQTSFTVSGDVTLNRPDVTITGARLNGILEFNSGASGSKLVNSNVAGGFNVWGADNIVIEGNTLDGQGQVTSNQLWDNPAGNGASGFTIRNNSFSNYRGGDCGVHGEGLFIGGYSANGLVEGNTFSNNGCTSHIFFSYFGTAGMGGYNSAQLPRNICVRGNTFGARFLNTYFDVNFRQEIAAAGPSATGIKVQPNASSTNPEFNASC
jgi:chitodextrinase